MSPSIGGRLRERRNPIKSNNIKVGVLTEMEFPSGKWIRDIPITAGSWPYTSSEAVWDQVHEGPPYKSGGPFVSVKASNDCSTVRGVSNHTSFSNPHFTGGKMKYWKYSGGFVRPLLSWESSQNALYGALSVPDPYLGNLVFDLDDVGPTAFDRCRPRIEEAGAAVFIAELRDLSGMLSTSAAFFKGKWLGMGGRPLSQTMADTPKEISDHFLNHNFGWVPFIADLLKFYQTWENLYAILKQKSKDNGKWINRVRTIDRSNSETVTRTANMTGIAWRPEFDRMSLDIDAGTYSRYKLEQVTSIDTRTWAKGQFKYYRPEFDLEELDYPSEYRSAMRLLGIFGARINPANLWRITPWTWLVDWFLGFGTYMDRIQAMALDGVAAKYLYVMKESVTTVRHTVSINWNGGQQHLVWLNKFHTKQREVAASPFSYTLPLGGLTTKQYAILAALGMGRLHW